MDLARTQENGYDVAIPRVSVTEERRPFIQKAEDHKLKDPGEICHNWTLFPSLILTWAGVPRANLATSVEAPNGTKKDGWAENYKDQTVNILNPKSVSLGN